METKRGVVRFSKHILLLGLILFQEVPVIFGRTTTQSEDVGGNIEVKADEEVQKIDFTVHILTKRDADDRPIGRTFPASDPLDPNAPADDNSAPLAHTQQDWFGDFEPIHEIFQPSVDGDPEQTDDVEEESVVAETDPVKQPAKPDQAKRPVDTDPDDTQVPDADPPVQPQNDYGAQYPYPQASRSSGSGQQSGTGYDSAPDQTYTSRRVVLTGRSGQPTTETEYVQTVHSSSGGGPTQTQTQTQTQYQTQYAGNQYPSSGTSSTYNTPAYNRLRTGTQYPSGTSRTQSTGYQTSRSYPTGTGRTYSGYQTSGSQYRTSGASNRGAPYNGPRYVDNNGHYIDASGRHLDSTGRYYDNSGRYQDATVTRTVTYQTHPSTSQRYTDSTGQSYGYVDSTATGTSGTQYTGNTRTQYTGNTGTQYTGNTRTQYTGNTGTRQTGSTGTSYGYGVNLPASGYSSGGSGGTSSQGSQYVTNQTSTTQIGGTPVNSYGNQFYSRGQSYPATYDPIVSQISNDPNCPVADNVQVTINGLTCTSAVSQLGPYICYNYERVNTECCERCLQVKQAQNAGCEYGDRSHECSSINPYDCYNERNSQVCCQRCREFQEQRTSAPSTCQYGDMTPRCSDMIQRSFLCYLPENQRVCCETCPRLANQAEPDCRWGNQNPELCSEPFDAGRRLRLNCYLSQVREICCSTCKSLRQRIRQPIPGCEYGDHPVQISTSRGVMDCGEYIRQYGVENCDGGELAQKCCYTCYRYRNRRQQQQQQRSQQRSQQQQQQQQQQQRTQHGSQQQQQQQQQQRHQG